MTTTTKTNLKRRVQRKTSQKQALRRFYLAMTADGRYDFLKLAQTTDGYIRQIYLGFCECSPEVAQRVSCATGGKVGAWTLRPDVYEKPAAAAAKSV